MGLKKYLWLDELYTLQIIREDSVFSIISKLYNGADTNAPLYFVLLKLHTYIFGTTEISLKLFSFACIIGSLHIFYKLIDKFGVPAKEKLSLLLLLIVFPSISTYLFTEVRPYSLLLLFELLFLHLYLDIKKENSIKKLISLGIVTTCLVYTHYFTFYFILPFILYELFFRKPDLKLLLSIAIALLLFLPWLPVVMAQIGIGQGLVHHKAVEPGDLLYNYEFLIGKIGILLIAALTIMNLFKKKAEKNYEYLPLFILISILPILNIILSSVSLSVQASQYFIGSAIGLFMVIILLVNNNVLLPRIEFFFLIIALLWGGYRVIKVNNYYESEKTKLQTYSELNSKNIPVLCESPHLFYPLDYYARLSGKSNYYFILDSVGAFCDGNIKNAPYDFYLIKNYRRFYKMENVSYLSDVLNNNDTILVINEENRMFAETNFLGSKEYIVTSLNNNILSIRKNEN